MSEYGNNAIAFAKKHGIKLHILDEEFRPYFPGDAESRSVFKCRLTRKGKQYTFNFGQALAYTGKEPSMYDVLVCLTKSDPSTYQDFCWEYGYESCSRTAYQTYKAVVKEWKAVNRMFGDCLNDLQEIY